MDTITTQAPAALGQCCAKLTGSQCEGCPLSTRQWRDQAHETHLGIAPRAATGPAAPARPYGTVAVPEAATVARGTQEEAIDGDLVLQSIRVCLAYTGVWPSAEALNAATMYVGATHGRQPDAETGWTLPVWQKMPRFFITGSLENCGKSHLGAMMLELCPDGKTLVEPTKAALIEIISQQKTVQVTELDILLGTGTRNRPILAILNAGYERRPTHTKMKNGKATEIPLFGAMILDGLDVLVKATGGELRTLFSRSLIVRAQRAPKGYRPPRFDATVRQQFREIRELTSQWMAQQVALGIGEYVPQLPEGVGNRAAAIWEPLFAVADRAGGEWPELCADACERLESATGLPPQEAEAKAAGSARLAEWAAAAGVGWGKGEAGQ